MRLQEAIDNYLRVDRAESTRETYRKVLCRFAQYVGPHRPLERVTPEEVDAYIYDLRHIPAKYADHPTRPTETEPLSDATIYKISKTIKAFFNWCVKRKYLAESPACFLTVQRPDDNPAGKAATPHEVSEIIGAAFYKPRDRALVMLLAQSGARAGEVANLQIGDLDLGGLRAYVRDPKNRENRYIYFEQDTADALLAWLKKRPEVGHNYVFISWRDRQPIRASAISQMIRRRCAEADLARTIGSHAFRHFVAKTLFNEGEDPRVIRDYLGHKSLEITWKYGADVHDNDLHRAAQRLKITRSDRVSWGSKN
jgi:integrase